MNGALLFALVVLLSSVGCISGMNANEQNCLDFFEGVLAGFFSTGAPDLRSCVDGAKDMLSDLEGTINSLSSHDKHEVVDGLKGMARDVATMAHTISSCRGAASELQDLYKALQSFSEPETAIIHVGEEMIWHGRNIFDDIKHSIDDFKARQYENSGSNIGSALATILDGKKPRFWPDLSACSLVPDTNGHVNIPAEDTSVKDNAYQSCPGPLSITFPPASAVTTIGDNAFRGSDLLSVKLPAAVETVGQHAFHGADKLQSVSFDGKQLTSVGAYAFAGLPQLQSISFPAPIDGQTLNVGAHAFSGDTGLTNLSFACDSKATIASDAFSPASTCGLVTSGKAITAPVGVTYNGSDVKIDHSKCDGDNSGEDGGDKPAGKKAKDDHPSSAAPEIAMAAGGVLFLAVVALLLRHNSSNKQAAAADAASEADKLCVGATAPPMPTANPVHAAA